MAQFDGNKTMTYYQFEPKNGILSANQAKQVVAAAGYTANHYSYDQAGTKQVDVKPNAGAGEMSPNTLEHAAKKAIGKDITVTYIKAEQSIRADDGTPYSILITMMQKTVDSLTNGAFSLLAWKSVQASGGGVPVVWFASQTFGLQTSVNWYETYQGYTSNQSDIPNGQITATNAYGMTLGQTLSVIGQAGTGEVSDAGPEHAITIENQSGFEFTAGISQVVGTTSNPLCAFPLYGSAGYQIAPIEKVLLMFATGSINTGQVIYNALTRGIMIDLTADNNRTVAFDINSGWDWGNAGWAHNVGYDAQLVPLLIDSVTQTRRRTLIGY
jgi:hypothetical protein